MKRMSLATIALACSLAVAFGSLGCAKAKYRETVSANRNNVQRLQLGMSRENVARVMGDGEIVNSGRIQLANPWRSESFILQDEGNTRVAIFYYLTEPQLQWRTASDRELTPVVLENGQVVGWGWSYLRRNMDRYAISTPHEQR